MFFYSILSLMCIQSLIWMIKSLLNLYETLGFSAKCLYFIHFSILQAPLPQWTIWRWMLSVILWSITTAPWWTASKDWTSRRSVTCWWSLTERPPQPSREQPSLSEVGLRWGPNFSNFFQSSNYAVFIKFFDIIIIKYIFTSNDDT